jgi:thiol-disulfide isomerase/thioredoxin
MLLKVEAGSDRFINEKYADEIAAILGSWSAELLRSPHDMQTLAKSLAPDFRGAAPKASGSREIRHSSALRVLSKTFERQPRLDQKSFLQQWQAAFADFSKVEVAEFQLTRIESEAAASTMKLRTEVRYEIVGTGAEFYRRQRVGNWELNWQSAGKELFLLTSLTGVQETEATSYAPYFVDVTALVLGSNVSYREQLLHGTEYWRTVLDGACGIDVYGHNGISVADLNGNGLDDLYVCQPAGLPNRLFRNRGDGTFEDITEASGLGILENTSCALFADFNNDGHQDVIVVRESGPLLFLNDGSGKFLQKADAFLFANSPQGTFTGAAVGDYDRDGWLDIYFCLYNYYQGTGQYRYPSPYHDAENGPPNFLMRNNRNATFRDVTAETGLNQNNTRYSFCCAWDDFNRDGWPDLYVVNDFGRKNLYRNNRDGTFTDVAPEARVEDLGAGMSVTWLDYDNDGAEDLYVANMWTAAGLRISTHDSFKKDSSSEVRSLYQKHAMGNSLLQNRSSSFADATKSSGTGIGRWAWSSDAFDFDHDGFPDIYVANGMVSGPSRSDLNSFFWRQVVANSPDQAASSREYEQGWAAINELIRSDRTWSGHERNIFYANNRDGTFSDVSAAIGLDFIEDSRSFALADFDHDGRLELVLKNRSAPQLRILKNVAKDLPPSIIFQLRGTKSNLDAIGTSVTIEAGSRRQTQTVRVGSGFLSQHSKALFFGLGDQRTPVHAVIRWPNGLVLELRDLPINHRIWVQEGTEQPRAEPFPNPKLHDFAESKVTEGESLPSTVATWLLSPVPAPDFSLADIQKRSRTLSALRGNPILLHFWTSKCETCFAHLRAFQPKFNEWSTRGLHLLALNADQCAFSSGPQENANEADLEAFVRKGRITFPILRAADDVIAI